jgi:hypothetical protein
MTGADEALEATKRRVGGPALHAHGDFCKLHKAHRLTPAMAAGVTDRLREVADIVKVLEEWENANER